MPPDLEEDAGKGSDIAAVVDPNAAAPAAPSEDKVRDDVDDLDLEALREAANAEVAGGDAVGGKPETQAQPGSAGQDQQPQPPPKPGTRPMPQMIPKPRFDETLREKAALEAELARKDGEIIALRAKVQQAPPAVNPRIAEIDQAVDALAAKFDDGQLSATEWKRQERQLLAEQTSLREQDLLDKVKQQQQPQPTNPAPAVDLYVEEKTAQLEATYDPYVNLIPSSYLDGVVAQARHALEAEGHKITPDARGTLLLQERVGQIAYEKREAFSAISGRPVPQSGTAQNGKTPAGKAPPNGITREMRSAKLALQENMPPNIGSLTRSEDLNESPNDAVLENMDDEDITALPTGVRYKHLGITS